MNVNIQKLIQEKDQEQSKAKSFEDKFTKIEMDREQMKLRISQLENSLQSEIQKKKEFELNITVTKQQLI